MCTTKQEACRRKAIRIRGIEFCFYSVIAISLYYPTAAISQEPQEPQEPTLLPQVAHTKPIRTIAVSPDEQYVWSGGEDGKCAMWNLRTMKVLDVWAEQESNQFLGKYPIVNAAAWSPNGRYIASGGQDRNLIVWEVSSKKKVFKEFFGKNVCAIEFSDDSKEVFVGLEDGEIKIYRVEFDEAFIPFGGVEKPNRYVGALRGHEGKVEFIKRLGGKKVVSVSSVWTGEKSSIKIWDLESKKQVKAFSELQERVYSIAVSLDSNYIATVGSAKTVRIWDLESGKQVLTIKGVTDNQYEQCSLAYTADGKTLVLGEINAMKFFDVKTGKLKQLSTTAALNLIYLQKERVFLATLDKQIRLIDAEKGVLIRTSSSFKLGSAMECVAIHPSQNIFVTGGGDGNLRIWDMQTASLEQVVDSKGGKLISVKITPDGKTVITTDGTEIKIFEIKSGKLKKSIKVNNVNALALSSDGNELAAGSDDQDVEKEKKISILEIMSYSASQIGNDEKVKKYAQIGLDNDPKNKNFVHYLADLYAEKGYWKNFAETWKSYYKNVSSDKEAPYWVGYAYGKMGNNNEATYWLKIAARNGNSDAQRILRSNGLSW